ncbi:MAG: double-strand break repair helicase AddA [Hyphomicrobiaceae bacterium]
MSALAKALADTERNQSAAADPAASAWVSANAGAGKTHVLKSRVLRLLIAGTPPERILCLTYTKAAATEMEQRVFADLAVWATCEDDLLAEHLAKLLGRKPTAEETANARRLFARAIETPGGLKVETIHAFCQRLLQRFPLEAVVPPGFGILDEETGSRILREAIDDTLFEATRGGASELADALRTVVVYAQGDQFDELIGATLASREWVRSITQLGDDRKAGLDALARIYRDALGLGPRDTRAALEAAALAVLDDATMQRAVSVLIDGKTSDLEIADGLRRATKTSGSERLAALQDALLTQKREPRSDLRFVTKAVREAEPALYTRLVDARDRFAGLLERRDATVALEVTLALLRIADAVLRRHTDAKIARGMLDYDDLIARTVSLLSDSEVTAWVLYKLDGGIDHILVDEAQDTSPEQWRIVEALAREFFSGSGAREDRRTIFAVGDEKQSIYSFQGADPRQFAEMGDFFATATKAAGESWRPLSLELSFRTVAPVLEAVDRVFADPSRTPGLSTRGSIRHYANRAGHGGLVEIWKPEPHEPPDSAPAFDPLHERAASSAVKRLADRIAATIHRWLKDGTVLASTGRPIRPGDIMILVRRRRPFGPLMVAALKAKNIPVAGADRMLLSEQIAVKDLLALGHVLALPEDDLSLAAVLKSPLFDLDDNALLAIAPQRKGTLYNAVLAAAATDARFTLAADTLKKWRQIADFLPPYELFTRILDNDRMRAKLLGRLGIEAAEAIDEFLSLALGYDDANPASLAGFLDAVGRTRHEIKRDLEHGGDEVRVLTVHGAKGLEAPIVFLPDTCGTTAHRDRGLVTLDIPRPQGLAEPRLWPVSGAGRLATVTNARARRSTAETEESNRLLYVAMTRARDRLYVAGWETARARRPECWYDTIAAALDGVATSETGEDGAPVRRLVAAQTVPPKDPGRQAAEAIEPVCRPAWAKTVVPPVPRAAIPVAPSRLAPLDIDEDGEPVATKPAGKGAGAAPVTEPAGPSPAALAADNRFLRGTITHALLEHLPSLPQTAWDEAASGFVAHRAGGLAAGTQRSIVTESLAVLRDAAFVPVFAPGSRAEVPLVAELRDPAGRHPPLRINGQIDRMARIGPDILILDYKTNRPPPAEVSGVPLAYQLQLAAYRLAVAELFPGTTIRAAILWTYGPRLMELPGAMMDQVQLRLWELATSP